MTPEQAHTSSYTEQTHTSSVPAHNNTVPVIQHLGLKALPIIILTLSIILVLTYALVLLCFNKLRQWRNRSQSTDSILGATVIYCKDSPKPEKTTNRRNVTSVYMKWTPDYNAED
ncbi:hypothetical protein KOW79_020704 [Hemibagrus wyckioides]|uniref:Uncharacterized protein n=1 Tax=Hemibagrus wyckioides TaxID=337641 RepID=A0A9D3N6S4_9TELE|nr:hypothetical protein KOW79_020704 [Hemibagrus wyckioides]